MTATVVLYSTSVPTLPKVRADIATIKRILEAKKVDYEEVSTSCEGVARPCSGMQMRRLLVVLGVWAEGTASRAAQRVCGLVVNSTA
jgi:hypothetical protein